MKIKETGHNPNCEKDKGGSTEVGCFQHKPSTWAEQSIQVLGYVSKPTKVNQEYVTLLTIDNYVKKGYTPEMVAKKWNKGNLGACSSGYNEYDQWYDSCDYINKFLEIYNQLK